MAKELAKVVDGELAPSAGDIVSLVLESDGYVRATGYLQLRSHGDTGHLWLKSHFPGCDGNQEVLIPVGELGRLVEILSAHLAGWKGNNTSGA